MGCQFPSPGDLLDPEIEPRSPTLQADSLPTELQGRPNSFWFLAALSLHCYTQAFSSCSQQGLPFVAVLGFLIVVGSLVVEHGLRSCGPQA